MSQKKHDIDVTIEFLEQRIQFNGPATFFLHTSGALSYVGGNGTAVSIGRMALFVGGGVISNPHPNRAIDIYDQDTTKWSTYGFPHASFAQMAATAIDGRVIFVGGRDLTRHHSGYIADIYNPKTNIFTSTRSPHLRTDSAAFSIMHRAVFAGGGLVGDAITADVYNPRTGDWKTERLPIASGTPHAAVIGNHAFITTDSSHFLDVYNGASNRWSTLSMPDQFVAGQRISSVGSKLIVSGTRDGTAANSIIIFDTITETWQSINFPQPSLFDNSLSLGTKVIFAGGGGTTGTLVETYDFQTAEFAVDQLIIGRDSIAATTVGTQALFAGGATDLTHAVNTVDIFTDTSPSPVLSGGLTGNIGHRDQVTIINTGDADLAGPYGIQLYASLDRTLNGAILVGTRGVTTPLPAGASATFGVRTILPKDTPAGTYHLLATISDGTGHLTPIAAEDATIRVGGKQVAKPAGIRDAKSRAGAFTRAAHSAQQWT